jgi:hypothetical protein
MFFFESVLAMFGSKKHPIFYEQIVQLYIREKQLAHVAVGFFFAKVYFVFGLIWPDTGMKPKEGKDFFISW